MNSHSSSTSLPSSPPSPLTLDPIQSTTNESTNISNLKPLNLDNAHPSSSFSSDIPTAISDSPIAFEFPIQQQPIRIEARKVKRSNYKNSGPRNSKSVGGSNSSSSSNSTNQLEAKVVILGSQGVGKTSLVTRYTTGAFSYSLSSTIGASFLTKKLIVDGCTVRFSLWDTAGQERFRSMAPLYYRDALAAVLVYDITNQASFNDVKGWLEELRRTTSSELLIHVVGSKADLAQTERVVDLQQARKTIAEWIGSPNLSVPTNSRESSPSPRKERARTMSTRTGGSNPSLKASTVSTSSSTTLNNNTPSPVTPNDSISPPLIPSSSVHRSRKLSTKNSISVGVSGTTSSATNTTVFASDLSVLGSGSGATAEGGLTRSGGIASTAIKGVSSGSRRGGGKAVEEERKSQEEEERERGRIESMLRENGIEVSEVSAKDDYGIEDLFLAILSRLLERRSQIETNRILRSRDSFMLTDSNPSPEQSTNGWCCT